MLEQGVRLEDLHSHFQLCYSCMDIECYIIMLILADFPINFACGKLVVKVRNSNLVTAGYCDCYNCTLGAKYPNCDYMTVGIL